MKEMFAKDISEMKEFTKYGDTFRQIRNNPETGWWLYERRGKGNRSYEVVKGKKFTNPDGTTVRCYPSSNDWGNYGYTIMENKYSALLIDFIMSARSRSAEEMWEFKKSIVNALN
jgi:hypothetical protein